MSSSTINASTRESTDASRDASRNASRDASRDASMKASIDASIDAGIDASNETVILQLQAYIKTLEEENGHLRKTNELLVKSMEALRLTSTPPAAEEKKPVKKHNTVEVDPKGIRYVEVPSHITGLVLGKQFAVIKAMCAAERKEAKKHNVDPWCRIDQDGETKNATGESFLVLKISARDPRVAEQLLSRVCDRIEQSL